MLPLFSKFRKKKKHSSVVINFIDDAWIAEFCLQWNLSYPIDRWWRNKHKVAFNSPEHRVVSFFDMRFEYEEDMLFKRRKRISDYQPNKGDWLIIVDEDDSLLSEEARREKYRKEFDELDLSQYGR